MNDRKVLVQNFAEAALALTNESLNELNEEKRKPIEQVLASGAAHVRLIVVLGSPVTVVGALYSSVDRAIPPQVLFRIGDPGPQNEDWN